MKFRAIPESQLRQRVADLARYLDDYDDLPPELGGARTEDEPLDMDVVDGAIRYIRFKRSQLHDTIEWLEKKQRTINDLRRERTSAPSAFRSAGEVVQKALVNAEPGNGAIAAAVYSCAVALKSISDTLERITGQTEVERLRDELEFLKEQAGARFRKEGR